MKKNLFIAAIMLSIGGTLAACGTSESGNGATNGSAGEQVEETVAEETTENETAVDETASESAENPTEAEGTLTLSDEQPYELNVLSGYALTSEEPGKDSLYSMEDSSVFMRIETFAPGEMDFSQADEQLKETLGAVNAEAEIAQGPALEGTEFINSSSYEIPSAEGTVTGIVFEKEDQLVRLTIFDNSAVNATEDFIAMGKTIQRTE